jgi:hypothetical protein
MMRVVLAAVVALVAAAPAHAAGHRVECSALAPAEWGTPRAALSGVDVLATPAGEAIDDKAPPTLVPDDNTITGNLLNQRWDMRSYDSGWRLYIDCHYRDRVLRLEAPGVKTCARQLAPFDRKTGAGPHAKDSLYCD